MRTQIKDRHYLSSFIQEAEELNTRNLDRLSLGKVKPVRVMSIRRFVYSGFLHSAICRYSIGAAPSEMKPDLVKAITMASEVWCYPENDPKYSAYLFDWYTEAVWLLSISFLLKLTADEIAPMITVLDNSKDSDWLLESLLGPNGEGRLKAESLVFPKIYGTLKEAAEENDPIKASVLVKRYLEKEWYPRHRQAYWHDIHKSKHVVFFGYWSFEAAAVVKIAGIDDSSFRDNQYYPKDLLG